MHALPSQCPAAQARHVGLGSGFIQEDQFCRIQPGLATFPFSADLRYVRPILFAGAECLFLYVIPFLTVNRNSGSKRSVCFSVKPVVNEG